MVVDGVSQTSGVERVLDLSQVDAGVLVVIREGKHERVRVVLPGEELAAIITDFPKGPQTVVGTHGGEKLVLNIEVRRNEVLLSVGDYDVAVGLDDLVDAISGAIPAA